jgi:Domain of unknown function (DUF3597)
MSIFGSIMSKIFGHGAAPASASSASAAGSAAPSGGQASSSASSASTASTSATSGPVDVEAVLTGMAKNAGQTLDWRHSIVDLMKLLGLDSSLAARKELAQELGYSGDMNDSAGMNIWLHKQVMQKLAENGGKVPDSLRT